MIIEIRPVTDGFNIELTPESPIEEDVLRAAKVATNKEEIDIVWWGDTEPTLGQGMKIHFTVAVLPEPEELQSIPPGTFGKPPR